MALTVTFWANSGPTSAAVHSSSAAALPGRLQRLCPAVSRRAQSLRTDSFPTLHRRFAGGHRTAWTYWSSVCWRYADLRLLSSVGCPEAAGRVSGCVDDVAIWMQSNRLQFIIANTEVLWCASIRRQHQIPQPGLRVGVDVIVPSASVRDLGIYLDCDVSMRTHVSKVVSSCFAVLRRLRSICSSVTRPVFVSLVVSMVLSRLDYGNATLAGITVRLMARLRSVLKRFCAADLCFP